MSFQAWSIPSLIGVVEYWSIGVLECKTAILLFPTLQYSIPPVLQFLLLYKLIVIIGSVHIQGRPLLHAEPRFPREILLSIFVQLLGKLSHGYSYRAHPLASPAVGAPPRTVIGPQKMKGHRVRRIVAFSHPLRS